jgi:hypothetical protein
MSARIFLFLFLLTSVAFSQVKFSDFFHDKTLRMDYYHSGNYEYEFYSLAELKEEPYWGGSKTNLVDTFSYGNYFVKLRDKSTGKILYSRGYSTLFREWQVTDEAREISRTFVESVVMPFPKKPAVIEIYSRNDQNEFDKKFEKEVDPKSPYISKEKELPFDKIKIHYTGDPSEKVDFVFLAEGYTKAEQDTFKKHCEKYAEALFDYEPFGNYKDEINIWGVESYSDESGVDLPGDSIWKRTHMDASYWTLKSERYLMAGNFGKVRDAAANAPYDHIVILANHEKYGGGGIFNYYAITSTKNELSKQVFIHELGHSFGALGDEYGYDSTYNDFYREGIEPWEPNLTTLTDFSDKWEDMIDEDTPIPTPQNEEYKDVIGVFEGAGYVAKGVYRPTYSSIMRSLSYNEFNKISKKAMIELLKFYSE